jgi:hypothetical protein
VVFDRVQAFLRRFGSLALSLAALLPPPFPTSVFVLGAGATGYRFGSFVASFGGGRADSLCWLISRLCLAGAS